MRFLLPNVVAGPPRLSVLGLPLVLAEEREI